MAFTDRWELTIQLGTDPTVVLSQKTLDTAVAAAATAVEAVAGVAVRGVRLNARPYSPITPYLPSQNRSAETWVP